MGKWTYAYYYNPILSVFTVLKILCALSGQACSIRELLATTDFVRPSFSRVTLCGDYSFIVITRLGSVFSSTLILLQYCVDFSKSFPLAHKLSIGMLKSTKILLKFLTAFTLICISTWKQLYFGMNEPFHQLLCSITLLFLYFS